MAKSTKKPEPSVIASLRKTGGFDLLVEYGEITLDSFLEEGLLKDIPLIGTIIKVARTGAGISELLFLKKLQRFLFALKNIPQQQREAFAEEIEANEDKRTSVGTKLLLILDRLDDVEKSEMVGKAFLAYVTEEIDYEIFLRLARAIERCMTSDLSELNNINLGGAAVRENSYDLLGAGLIMRKGGDEAAFYSDEKTDDCVVTGLGLAMLQHVVNAK